MNQAKSSQNTALAIPTTVHAKDSVGHFQAK